MSDSTVVDYLVEFYPAGKIREFYKQVGDALLARSSVNIHINSSGRDGTSHSGISLTTQQEQKSFMESCKLAIQKLEGTQSVDPSTLGTVVNFSQRSVTV